jgi:hypothetical protein
MNPPNASCPNVHIVEDIEVTQRAVMPGRDEQPPNFLICASGYHVGATFRSTVAAAVETSLENMDVGGGIDFSRR